MTYIIAEAGQNHNGRIDYAMQLIDLAALKVFYEGKEVHGVNAIKFTKRDMKEELTKDAFYQKYASSNSFAETYGEHRLYLELTAEEHLYLYEYAKQKGLDFIETFCSIGAAKECLELFKPDKIKIASRDIDNLPLIEYLACQKIPMIFSCGMAEDGDIKNAYGAIRTYNNQELVIMDCVSVYPAQYSMIDFRTFLDKVKPLRNDKKLKVGFSDHTTGVLCPSVMVSIGAEYIEKHITLDKSLKGSDQAGSMDHEGLRRVVRDVRNTEVILRNKEKYHIDLWRNKRKLKRSISSARDIKAGETISIDDIILLSPGDGISWKNRSDILYKKAKHNICKHRQIKLEDVE